MVLAVKAHREAGSRYNKGPYGHHLHEVVQVLDEYNWDSPVLHVSAWLHDSLEDTALTADDIRKFNFLGEERCGQVIRIVEAVTTPASVGNRRARLKKLIEQLQLCPEALPLKLADRIANVRSCWANQDTRLFMYEREYREFRSLIAVVPPLPRPLAALEMMWRDLDTLHGWRR